MSAVARFNEVIALVAADLAQRGFRRKGMWFTHRPYEDERFWCISLRKIPQVASKRIVFQVVANAGRTAPGDTAPISTLKQALDCSTFEHHLTDGPKERLWTLWPSSDPTAISKEVLAAIETHSLAALARYPL